MNYTDIGNIQLQHNRVYIRGQVICKVDIITADNSPGDFTKVLLGDQTGVIYIFIYHHPFQGPLDANFTLRRLEIIQQLEIGQFYGFNGRVRKYVEQFTVPTHQNECELLFDGLLDIELQPIANCQVHVPFLFSSPIELNNLPNGRPVDVLGVVRGIAEANTGQENLEHFLQLEIEDKIFECNIWQDHSIFFVGLPIGSIIAIQGCKTTDWDGVRELHIGNTATIYKMGTQEERRLLHQDQADFFLRMTGEIMME